MVPVSPTVLEHFYESEKIRSLLERPGQLRYAGWDLVTHDQARIVKGDYIEVRSAERKRIHLYEDGSLFVRVPADEDFLSWGQNTNNFQAMPRLNTLALVEFTLNFCIVCGQFVTHMRPAPDEVNLNVEIKNTILDSNNRLFLIPSPVSSDWFRSSDQRSYAAPDSETKRTIRVNAKQLEARPDAAAFLLLRQIFLWFGVTQDRIPYSSSDGPLRFIDAEKIRNSRSS